MSYFYPDTSVRSNAPINVWKMDGTKKYLEHYSNLLMLQFFASSGTRSERADAEREILICQRKLDYWARHPNYVHAEAVRGVEALKRAWVRPA